MEDRVTRIELGYDRLGSRLRWIGDLELGYEEGTRGWLDNRPKYIVLPDDHSQLTEEQFPLTSGGQGNQFSDWQPTTAAPNPAPTITNVRPVPGSTTTDRTPTIAATVTDQQTNLAKSNLTLLVDDVTIPRTAFSYNRSTDRMSYTPEKKLSLRSHAVEVIAQDGSELSTTRSWSFEIVHP
jgi:hypothetical protein